MIQNMISSFLARSLCLQLSEQVDVVLLMESQNVAWTSKVYQLTGAWLRLRCVSAFGDTLPLLSTFLLICNTLSKNVISIQNCEILIA